MLILGARSLRGRRVMGLNLQRERFRDWLDEYGPDGRAAFLARLEHHIGRTIDVDAWQIEEGDDVESEAFDGFRAQLEPAFLEIPYAAISWRPATAIRSSSPSFSTRLSLTMTVTSPVCPGRSLPWRRSPGDSNSTWLRGRNPSSIAAGGSRSPRPRTWPGHSTGSSSRKRMPALCLLDDEILISVNF